MIKYYINGWKKMFQFRGRETRQAFWSFTLIHFLINFSLNYCYISINTEGTEKGITWYSNIENTKNLYILGVYLIFIFIPSSLCSLSYTVRRLHDIGKSGWSFLVVIIPLAGLFVLLYFLARPSQEEVNEYGVPVHERDDDNDDEEEE